MEHLSRDGRGTKNSDGLNEMRHIHTDVCVLCVMIYN